MNVLLGPRERVSVAELAALGVKRISVGGLLANVAFGALIRAAEELLGSGTFTFADGAAPGKELDALIARGAAT